MSLLVLTLVTVIFPTLAIITLFHLLKPEQTNKQPNPKSLFELIKNGHRIVEWTSDLLNSSPSGTVITFMGIITANPATVEHITKTKFDSYIKGQRSISILQDFLGNGIFNSDGGHWKLQRRTASLEFSTKVIRTFVVSNIHSQAAARLLPALGERARDGKVFDVQDLLDRFAFNNVCKVVFDGDLDIIGDDDTDKEGREFNEAFERASSLCVERFSSVVPGLWRLKRLLNVGSEREVKENIGIVHRFATKAVRSRKGGRVLGDDMLSRFIAESEGYDEEFLRDVVVSFVLAGRDSTSATLAWFFWDLRKRPEIVHRLLDEIDRVRGKDKNAQVFSLNQVREMEYMHAALSETLRLHPPVPLQQRRSVEDDVLPDGTEVKKGTLVLYNSYAMGRSSGIWGEDWEEYRPERWLDEEGVFQPRSPYVYPVFHAGPRMCLGKDMAYVQMKMVAAAVLERFEVEVVDKEKEKEYELNLIAKMKGGLMVKVKERK